MIDNSLKATHMDITEVFGKEGKLTLSQFKEHPAIAENISSDGSFDLDAADTALKGALTKTISEFAKESGGSVLDADIKRNYLAYQLANFITLHGLHKIRNEVGKARREVVVKAIALRTVNSASRAKSRLVRIEGLKSKMAHLEKRLEESTKVIEGKDARIDELTKERQLFLDKCVNAEQALLAAKESISLLKEEKRLVSFDVAHLENELSMTRDTLEKRSVAKPNTHMSNIHLIMYGPTHGHELVGETTTGVIDALIQHMETTNEETGNKLFDEAPLKLKMSSAKGKHLELGLQIKSITVTEYHDISKEIYNA